MSANVRHGDVARCHGFKGRAADEAFQEQFFLLVQTLTFFNFQDLYKHENIYKTLNVRGGAKMHDGSEKTHLL